ncbi:MAG: M28 family metallopeptidase [Treponema sp.]|nr:M28 family metallopeptidase [Treponema sp.]
MTKGRAALWATQSPFDAFLDFIAPGADRFEVLLRRVRSLGLNSVVLSIRDDRHFFVFPPGVDLSLPPGGAFPFKGESPTILTAHYDRVDGSPGANDNSAAVFILLKAALRMAESQDSPKWMIIFTDSEELRTGQGICEQGAYSLALKLRRLGLGAARVFNFDACGTGETFVVSSTADYLFQKTPERAMSAKGRRMKALREKVFQTARALGTSHVLSAPTPFSDDAGFLQGGIPSQTITMLPSSEAAPFASLLRNRPAIADAIIFGSASARRFFPETWRRINGPEDTLPRLTPENFDRIARFAVELCKGQ